MSATPSIVIGKEGFGIKNGNLLGYYRADDGIYVARQFTATRGGGTNGTFVNSSGLIEVAASPNLPRIDFSSGSKAVLIEPAATNLAWHSETWASGTNWNLTNNVTTATGTTGTLDPLGTNTANAISPTSASGTHFLFSNANTLTYVSGTIYTQSAFFKQGTGSAGRYVQLTFASFQFSQLGYANFDLQLGTVAVVSGTSADANRAASIENYGNGWYRCRFTATCNSGGLNAGVIPVLITASGDTRSPSFTGVTGDILYGWGAQLETGSVATTYIPTTTGTITRNADVITLANASGYIGQTEGTLYAEVDIRNMAKETYTLEVDDGVNANRIIIRSLTNNQMRGSIVATTSSGTIGISSATFTSGIVKIAFAYKSGDFALSVNGAAALTASGTFTFGASLNRITLGSVGGGGIQLNDRLRAAAIYTTRLDNTTLANITRLT